jgi:hypothetical protein
MLIHSIKNVKSRRHGHGIPLQVKKERPVLIFEESELIELNRRDARNEMFKGDNTIAIAKGF